jgi:hypothetical protein
MGGEDFESVVAGELLKAARELVSAKPPTLVMKEAMDAAYDLVDGIEGWMSETGDFPSQFWKPDVLTRYDSLSSRMNRLAGQTVSAEELKSLRDDVYSLLDGLLDGLEGVASEQGGVPSRYWRRGVERAAKRSIAELRRLRLAGLGARAFSARRGW